ncbi:MAG: DUF2065 domain-containing protein [Gammaproteobacteria bacterium]|nr:DUF2065 domain-containing protein [Gammaproteobacteria bacterium]
MWKDFWTAIALVLIIEGILPFLSPQRWQKTLALMVEKNPRFVRTLGLLSMGAGALLLFWIRH